MRFNSTREFLNRSATFFLSITSIMVICYLAVYQYKLITFPYPIQYREAAILLSTKAILNFQNPYSFELQPYYCNAYGIMYNFIVLPFAFIFGPTLIVHKAVSGFFTIATLGYTFFIMRKFGALYRYALPATAVLYSSLLYSKTSLAEPDITGTFFLLLSIAIPITKNYTKASLVLSIILSCIAFFTKPYFIFGILVVFMLLCFRQEWKKALFFTITASTAIILELVIIISLFESYKINALIANYNYGKVTSEFSWVFHQLKFIISNDKFYYSSILLTSIFYFTSKKFFSASKEKKDFGVASVTLIFIFLIFLGKNTGAYATYFYQLPLLFIIIFGAISATDSDSLNVTPLVKLSLILAVINIPLHYNFFEKDFKGNEKQWLKAKNLVASHSNILNSPAIAPYLIERNIKVYDSGQTGMFFFGNKLTNLLTKYEIEKSANVQKKFEEEVYLGVANRKFDLIMLDRSFSNWIMPPTSLIDNYTYKELITLEMPHNDFRWLIDVWEPKR